jgi:hypothetical protein
VESEHPQHPPGTSRGAQAPPLHRIRSPGPCGRISTFFRNAFSISSSRLRRSSSRSRARSDNSSGGSSSACSSRYFRTHLPTVVSFRPYSRATCAIGRAPPPPVSLLLHQTRERISDASLPIPIILSGTDLIRSAVRKVGGTPQVGFARGCGGLGAHRAASPGVRVDGLGGRPKSIQIRGQPGCPMVATQNRPVGCHRGCRVAGVMGDIDLRDFTSPRGSEGIA